MGNPIEDLQQADQLVQHFQHLLNEADVDIEQLLAWVETYNVAHGHAVPAAPELHEALRDIQAVLKRINDLHNHNLGRLQLVREQAQLHESP